ncbi:MAG: hypothetical protein QNL04_04905 [SAR324 cluster bacterium]|nr:hypothetical protein [SAR324 cluster bacterium]
MGITNKKKVFHSLRHTAADFMKQCGVEDKYAEAMLGHTPHGQYLARYGKDYKPDVLMDNALSKLSFPIDVKGLKDKW